VNDPATAADWLTQAASANPSDVRLIAALAEAQIRGGDRTAAQATIARGLDKDPNNAQLLNLKLRTEKARLKF
jgi:Flp pilus assembly protein TadD